MLKTIDIDKHTVTKLDANEKLNNADSKGKPTKSSNFFHQISGKLKNLLRTTTCKFILV